METIECINPVTRINSWLATLLFTETIVCFTVGSIISIPYISVLFVGILVVTAICVNINQFRVSPICMMLFGLFFAALVVSCLLNGFEVNKLYLLYFFVFGFAACMIFCLEIDYKRIVQNSLIVYFVAIIVYFVFIRNDFKHDANYWNAQMGVAYGFAPAVLIAIAFILYYKQFKRNRYDWLFALATLIGSLFIVAFDCGTRGALLVVLCGLFLLLIGKLKKRKQIIALTILVLLILMVIININAIMQYISDAYKNSEISALKKMAQMVNSGNEDNGRTTLYNDAIEMIKERPIFGNGVGAYEALHNGLYVHNIFFEVACEFGILGIVFLLLYVIMQIKYMIVLPKSPERIFLCLTFSISFVLLLFSSSYWLLPSFWISIVLLINCKNKSRAAKNECC